MTTTTPTPVLYDGVIYLAHDRFVCADVGCAGSTALYTGRTIGGAVLTAITGRDVIEWASMNVGPLVCECGRLGASFSMREGLRVQEVAR